MRTSRTNKNVFVQKKKKRFVRVHFDERINEIVDQLQE